MLEECLIVRKCWGFLLYRVVRFNSVDILIIYFSFSFGGDNIKIYYIGFKGDFYEVSSLLLFVICWKNNCLLEKGFFID